MNETPRNTRYTNATAFLAATALLTLLSACSTSQPVDLSLARPFPQALEQARVLDIQVRREPTTLTLTNTTASDIPPCTMWLNKRYSRPFPALAVGGATTLDLNSFIDEFGERFRPGGFWATRPSQRVVLAQFEVPDPAGSASLLGTVVINGEEDPDARRRQANPF